MLFGDIKPSALSFCDAALHRLWHEIYGEHLDFVVIDDVESEQWSCFEFENGLCSFCTKLSQFMTACYRWNYAKFGRNMTRCLCQLILERQEIAERDDITVIVNQLIVSLVNILDDKRHFAQMLWKSMSRHRVDGQQQLRQFQSPSPNHHHPGYHEMRSASDHSADDHDDHSNQTNRSNQTNDEATKYLFERVLSLILVNVLNLRMDGRHHRHQPLSAEAANQIERKVQFVLKPCNRWRVDEKSKLIIRHFFAYHFKGMSEFNGTCGGNGCIVQ